MGISQFLSFFQCYDGDYLVDNVAMVEIYYDVGVKSIRQRSTSG